MADVDLDALEVVVAEMTGGAWEGTDDADPDKPYLRTIVPGEGLLFIATADEDAIPPPTRRMNMRGIAALRNAAPALIAELRRLRGQTCETCAHSLMDDGYGGTLSCRKAPGECCYTACSALGNGCRAHEPKESVNG